MGLSSSKSTSKVDQTTKQTETATTTPQNPDWLTGMVTDYSDAVRRFGDIDPQSLVAPMSSGQRMASQNIGALGQWRGQSAAASGALNNILGQGAFTARAQQPPGPAGTMSPYNPTAGNKSGAVSPGQMQAPAGQPQGGDTAFAQSYGYQAPSAGTAQQATSQGYNANRLGDPILQGVYNYQAPQIDQASLVSGQGYTAPTLGQAQGYNASQAQGASGLDNLAAYQNPFTQQVVDSTAADMARQADEVRARQAAEGARAGAFGGSRFGLREAETEGQLARAQASTLGQLRAEGFERAAGLSQNDAQLRQQANLFNADASNQAAQFGANANNQFGLANAGLQADASRFSAEATNAANSQNALAQNSRSQLGAQLQSQAARDNAQAWNSGSLANAQFLNQFAMSNQDAANQAAQFGANANNTASMFNAGQGNQFALADADRQAQAAQFGAAGANAASLFNAGASNNMAQFNAGQQDNAANRGLQAAGMLGDLANQYGAGTRADLAAMMGVGEMERGVDQQQRMAELAQLQAQGNLMNPALYALFSGRTVNGTMNGTTNGTNTQTQTPSLFSSMLGGASMIMPFL